MGAAAQAEIGAAPKNAAAAFPPPTAKFPAPPGAKKPAATPAKPTAEGSKKNLLVVGGVVAVLVLGGGGFFAYKKFIATPAATPKPAVQHPPAPEATAQQTLDKAKQEQLAPLNEVVNADQAGSTKPVGTETQPATAQAETSPPVPAAPPPPPTASLAFKAWVQDLKISGVRAGANPRVFIGRTAYAPGDMVNPNLGISFVSYNLETRMLLFKDKSGATVELRN